MAPEGPQTPSSVPDPVALIEARGAAVGEVVTRLTGSAPAAVQHCAFGHGSVTYRVVGAKATHIVRTNDDPSAFRWTEQNLERLGGLGLPVPRVIAADLTRATWPFAYIVTDAFGGRDLRYELPSMSAPDQRSVARQVAGFQRLAATLPEGDGYGFAAIAQRAPHPDWISVVAAEIDRARADLPSDAAPALERVVAAVAAARPYFATVRPTCFLDDLTIKNVIVLDGRLQGVIDFDVVCFGDPLFQIGLTQTAMASDLPDLEPLYIDELCRAMEVTQHQRRIVNLYSAVFGLSFLGRNAGPNDGARALLTTIDAWLGNAIARR